MKGSDVKREGRTGCVGLGGRDLGSSGQYETASGLGLWMGDKENGTRQRDSVSGKERPGRAKNR